MKPLVLIDISAYHEELVLIEIYLIMCIWNIRIGLVLKQINLTKSYISVLPGRFEWIDRTVYVTTGDNVLKKLLLSN